MNLKYLIKNNIFVAKSQKSIFREQILSQFQGIFKLNADKKPQKKVLPTPISIF